MKSSNIGGQAVMEGIMMRHKDKYSIAVRRPDNEIELKIEDYKCVFGNAKFLKYVTVAVSIVVSVAAFMLLPYALASLCRRVGASEFAVTIVEAFVKLALFMGYMLLISRMKDIQRTFMYHGAEH